MISKWDARFLALAEHIASWSKDPSTQCGAVIVAPDRSVVSVGYNGFPRGVADHSDRLSDRDTKYALMVHAEMNAILTARGRMTGCALYVWPFAPCERCAAHVVQAGIVRVAAPMAAGERGERWAASLDRTRALLDEVGVELVEV